MSETVLDYSEKKEKKRKQTTEKQWDAGLKNLEKARQSKMIKKKA